MITLIRSFALGAFACATVAMALPSVSEAHDFVDGTTSTGEVVTDDQRSIACPLLGESTFSDSWGASRSGGRRHQGVDMIAPRGRPIVAAQAGEADFKQNRLGGNAIWITSDSGNKFYYAHLDRFEGSSRSVHRGEIIGYVGSTGNAKGPHLHFETHFDGSVGNPYDATYGACIQPTIDALVALNAIRRQNPRPLLDQSIPR
jgi:murein DD-endopeptidase MepM/ murein hydrolase activator NlpD